MPAAPRQGASWAALAAGPAAWVVSTQLNYALTPWVCEHGVGLVPWIALVLALAALAGSVVSWRARRGRPADGDAIRAGRFLSALGVLVGIAFAVVILAQGAAGLVFSGCEH
ncbi:MAG: hypothetical protein IRY94_05165 [Rhodospirillaceae bacterium]|nr:hypothetical protein [Rhodospirillaceae bacterium]